MSGSVGKVLERELPAVVPEEVYAFFARSMIRYDELKDKARRIRRLNAPCACAHADCSICLDPVDCGTAVVVTSCGHSFHSPCLFRMFYVSSGSQCPCPLCRSPISKDIFDGNEFLMTIFRESFLSSLVNFDRSYCSFLKHVQLRLSMLQSQHEKRSLMARIIPSAAHVKEADCLHRMLDALELIISLNKKGFENILNVMGTEHSSQPELRNQLLSKSFVKASDSSGDITAIRQSLISMGFKRAEPTSSSLDSLERRLSTFLDDNGEVGQAPALPINAH